MTAEIPTAGNLPRKRRSSVQKKLNALKVKTKRLQRRVWVLENHLKRSTRNQKEGSGQTRTDTTPINTVFDNADTPC